MRAYSVTTAHTDEPVASGSTEITDRLNQALATKLVGVLRCRRHYFLAKSGGSVHAVDMFLSHSNLEQAHADTIATRIVELGAEPGFAPDTIDAKSLVTYFERGSSVAVMAQEDLEATRITDAALAEFITFIGNRDAITRRMVLTILNEDRERGRELLTLVTALRYG